MFSRHCYYTLLWIFLHLHGSCSGLHIQRLTIPRSVKANSSEVILDCNYKVEEWESNDGFVLKWYINSVNLVYQWIPPHSPTILGSLKGRLDPRYRASTDKWKKHRALRIIYPDPSLTGTYTCTIATFEGEDMDSAKLVIWAPPSDVRINYWRPSFYRVNISCSSIGASPKPTFSLYKIDPDGSRHAIGIRGRIDFQGSSSGLYNSYAWGLISYERTKDDSVIGCSVSTRGKMFHETRETVYRADIPIITTTTSTPRPDEEAIKSPSIASLAISFQRPHKEIGTGIGLLLFIAFLNRNWRNEHLTLLWLI